MGENINISICVPALNEEKSLRAAVEDLILNLSYHVQRLEVIIVDDASSDSTPELAERLAREYPQVRVIHHEKKLGVGSCYRDALAVAGGDYFTWFPADHENLAEEFIPCLPYLDKKTIITCHHRGFDSRPLLRRFISRVYTGILNIALNLNLKYYNGLAIFPLPVLRSLCLVSDGFGILVESLVKGIKCGCRIVELAAPLGKRKWGKSKALTFPSIIKTTKELVLILSDNNANSRVRGG